MTLTFDLLTLKVVSESRVTWATPVPILVFLGLSVLELFQMYATERRQTDVRQKHRLMPPPILGAGHNNQIHSTVLLGNLTCTLTSLMRAFIITALNVHRHIKSHCTFVNGCCSLLISYMKFSSLYCACLTTLLVSRQLPAHYQIIVQLLGVRHRGG